MRASFTIEHHGQFVALVDNALGEGAMTITNDAESVVAYLYKTSVIDPSTRLVYRDTEGRWDEIAHAGRVFVGFVLHDASSLDEVMKKCEEKR